MSAQRESVLKEFAQAIAALKPGRSVRVAVDGVDGAGKTVFGDELAAHLQPYRPVVRASVDGFHNPRAIRHRLGRTSPLGYYRDSYDYDRFSEFLLAPFGPQGSRRYRRAAFDHTTDQPVDSPAEVARPDAALILDGIFLHRPELVDVWDFSIFLDVPFDVSVGRCAVRDGASPDPSDLTNQRYVLGQRLYFADAAPDERATAVVDNAQLATPKVIRWA